MTTDNYTQIFRRYVEVVGIEKAKSAEGLNEYLEYLADKGYKQNTIRFHYSAVKAGLEACDVDVSGVVIPEVDELHVERPTFTDDEIQALIKKAKDLGGVYVKAMAMSTIYGMRREELSRHVPSDIEREKKLLLVRTAKKGKPRQHTIPDEIVPYLTRDKMPSAWTLSVNVFNKIADAAGVNTEKKGWHSIRRALVTGLMQNLHKNGSTKDDVITFMRWKTGSMIDRYHIIDPGEDLKILEIHPFLEMWRESTND